MLVRQIKKRATAGRFGPLVEYLRDPQGLEERVGHVEITNCSSADLDVAVAEILAVQSRNRRAGPNRTYHLLISFRATEEPSPELLRIIEGQLVAALGMQEHQRISVVHRDTAHLHVHVAISKIHPTRYTINHPSHDYAKLGATAAQLEKQYGLIIDRHFGSEERVKGGAADLEAHTGTESLNRWLVAHADSFRAATTWEEIHRVASTHGVRIERRGQGLVFTAQNLGVKASSVARDLSYGKLCERLGEYRESLGLVPVPDLVVGYPWELPIDGPVFTAEWQRESERGRSRERETGRQPADGRAWLGMVDTLGERERGVGDRQRESERGRSRERETGRQPADGRAWLGMVDTLRELGPAAIQEVGRLDLVEGLSASELPRRALGESRRNQRARERQWDSVLRKLTILDREKKLRRAQAPKLKGELQRELEKLRAIHERTEQFERWARARTDLRAARRDGKASPEDIELLQARVRECHAVMRERREVLRKGVAAGSGSRRERERQRGYAARPLLRTAAAQNLFAIYTAELEARAELSAQAVVIQRGQLADDLRSARAAWRLRAQFIALLPASRFERRVLYMLARASYRRDLDAARERAEDRKLELDAGRRQSWLEWLRDEARDGNDLALTVLRSREVGPLHNAVGGTILLSPGRIPGAPIEAVTKTGCIIYAGEWRGIRDRGAQIAFSGSVSDELMQRGLHIALSRYGDTIKISGDETFRARIARIGDGPIPELTLAERTADERRTGRRVGSADGEREPGDRRRGARDASERAPEPSVATSGDGRGEDSTDILRPMSGRHVDAAAEPRRDGQTGAGSVVHADAAVHVAKTGEAPGLGMRRAGDGRAGVPRAAIPGAVVASGDAAKRTPNVSGTERGGVIERGELADRAIALYVHGREKLRLAGGKGIPQHKPYSGEPGPFTIAGRRSVQGENLVLLQQANGVVLVAKLTLSPHLKRGVVIRIGKSGEISVVRRKRGR